MTETYPALRTTELSGMASGPAALRVTNPYGDNLTGDIGCDLTPGGVGTWLETNL